MKWRIWYDDGRTFGSEDGQPEQAPGRGVICIVQDDERTARIRLTGDYYVWMLDRWFVVDLFGLWDYLAGIGCKVVKFGRLVDYEEYAAILRRADADLEFPPRSGWHPAEHRV